jgi:glutamyl-tRNA synthetase
MHIGGMRTALFNWLYARRHNGQFILRIDDTDQSRNIDEAVGPILRAFRWLGLTWDEGPEVGGENGPYFQSQRGDLYRSACDKLVADGKAYRCFDTPEQIAADRETAQADGGNYLNIRRSLELSGAQIEQYLAEGRKYVLRLLVPRDQKIEVEDEIRGHVEWNAGLISDPVIARADGSPLYNLATVVDDAQMNITHVIRAEEHLSNTPIQILINQALGNSSPTFAHIPFVCAPGTKKKMSKREVEKYRNNRDLKKLFDAGDFVFEKIGLEVTEGLNPVMVEFYERIGFLPAGVLNSLARTGWSFDDHTENMSLEFVTENFGLERVVKAPAALDVDKLLSYEAHWMNELSVADRVAGCLEFLKDAGVASDDDQDRVAQVVKSLGDRIKLFSDILTYDYFFKGKVTFNEKEFRKKIQKEGVPDLLDAFRSVLIGVSEWDEEHLEATLNEFCESKEIKGGVMFHALRIASTGSAKGPGLFDCLILVGQDKVIERIGLAVEQATSS